MGHAQLQLTYSEDSYSDIMEMNKALQDSYSTVDVRVGMSNDTMTAELYVDNLKDERGEISNTFVLIDSVCLI